MAKKRKEPAWREELAQMNSDALTADGFDDCCIGYADPWIKFPGGGASRSVVAVYDYQQCVQVLVSRDGMSPEEAVEFMDFNVTDAYVGDYAPIFMVKWPGKE